MFGLVFYQNTDGVRKTFVMSGLYSLGIPCLRQESPLNFESGMKDTYFMDLVAARASKLFMSGSESHKFVCFPDGCVRVDNEEAIRIGKTHMRNFGKITMLT